MATKKQKQELIDTLKFTPCTYKVIINGYGGETVMGRVDRKIVDYFEENDIDLETYATSWGEPGDEDYIEVPEDLRPFEQGSWYDCDNIEHTSGAEFGGAWITVYDENDNEVWQAELNHALEDLGCEIECFCSEDIEDHTDKDTAVFVGQNFEKGCFFDAELPLTRPFDPAKFKFTYGELAGWPVLNGVEYDGEDLDGVDGYSTTGKSMEFGFHTSDEEPEWTTHEITPDLQQHFQDALEQASDVPVLEGEEEWASKAIDDSLSDNTVSSFSTLVQALADREQQSSNETADKE